MKFKCGSENKDGRIVITFNPHSKHQEGADVKIGAHGFESVEMRDCEEGPDPELIVEERNIRLVKTEKDGHCICEWWYQDHTGRWRVIYYNC